MLFIEKRSLVSKYTPYECIVSKNTLFRACNRNLATHLNSDHNDPIWPEIRCQGIRGIAPRIAHDPGAVDLVVEWIVHMAVDPKGHPVSVHEILQIVSAGRHHWLVIALLLRPRGSTGISINLMSLNKIVYAQAHRTHFEYFDCFVYFEFNLYSADTRNSSDKR